LWSFTIVLIVAAALTAWRRGSVPTISRRRNSGRLAPQALSISDGVDAALRHPIHEFFPCRTILLTGYFLPVVHGSWEDAMQRRRIKQTTSLEHRLAKEAHRLRERAMNLPAGKEREALLQKARQTEVAAHVKEWISSPGLRPPT
jgi:hypothetical protein